MSQLGMSLDQNSVSPNLAWKTYLDGFNPCYFPALLDGLPDLLHDFHETAASLDVDNGTVLDFCSRHGLEPRCVFQTAWAIVVSCYSGLEDISFAFLALDGDSPSVQHDTALICRTHVTPEHFILDIMIDMMRKFNEICAHRNHTITKIQNLLGLDGQLIFNSGLQIQHLSTLEVGQGTQNIDLQKVHSWNLSQSFYLLLDAVLIRPYSATYWPEYRSRMTLRFQCVSARKLLNSPPLKQRT